MRVLVAMSGGVDSSVAAALLRDQGHDVVGATLKLWGGAGDSGCCSVADVEDARRVAQVLGIEHHVFAYTEEFRARVVEPYVRAHAEGRTPNPCIDCNRFVKFDLLAERARRLGFDALATGHYARIVTRHGATALGRGVDAAKDQSYVLAYLKSAMLDFLVLPIGEMRKSEVRARAAAAGLRTWDKPDSQDVCFIESATGRAGFLGGRFAMTPATVVDRDSGSVLGQVDAAELVTVGQRRHVPSPDGVRRYVTRVDVAGRRVEVSPLAGALHTRVELVPGSLSAVGEPLGDGPVWVQVSAHARPQAGRLRLQGNGVVELAVPIRPVAPGQTVVFYHDDAPDIVAGAALVASP